MIEGLLQNPVVQLVVGLGILAYVIYLTREQTFLLLMLVGFLAHALAWTSERIHRQLWHRRILRYVPGFTPPVGPKTAIAIAAVVLGLAGLGVYELIAPDHPTQTDWVQALESSEIEPSLLPVGLSATRFSQFDTPFEEAMGLELEVHTSDQDGSIQLIVFPDEPQAVETFLSLTDAARNDPEWAREHTVEYSIGPTEVICIDRQDGGVGCLTTAADGTLVFTKADAIDDDEDSAEKGARALIDLALLHWLEIADQVGFRVNLPEPQESSPAQSSSNAQRSGSPLLALSPSRGRP